MPQLTIRRQNGDMGSTTVLYSDILCPVPLWISVGAVVINLLFGLHPPALTCQVFDHFSDGVTQGTKVPVTKKSSFCIGKFASLYESASVTIMMRNGLQKLRLSHLCHGVTLLRSGGKGLYWPAIASIANMTLPLAGGGEEYTV